ncbi:MAG: hypothetical protein DSY82_07295 [Flavobacteriia bacterium]|nr:MAG: hypothetical protein DSY82_07295 [Flavobacteriia bacterium]
MKQKIRKSILQDAQHFVRIKNKLPLPKENKDTTQGGFLLGTDINTYKFYIENGYCLTGVIKGKIVGFGILLPNQIVKSSELWEKRKKVNWTININDLENNNVSFIEQLAFLRGHRKLSLVLSYNLVKTGFDKGADFILTTTVQKPIINTAAIPYIKSIGGFKIGNIDEIYPKIGNINSDIYLIKKNSFYKKIKELSFYELLKSNEL